MLAALGVEFEAVAPEIEELREGAEPEELVVENARRKAEAGLALSSGDDDAPTDSGAGRGEGVLALGVDTEVVLEGRVLGKARDAGEARERLLALSGRAHEVLSGVCVLQARRTPGSPSMSWSTRGSAEQTGVARSLVTFRELSDGLIAAYLSSGEWRDRAGAYAIQGLGSVLIERLQGDFSNVVGLPLQLLLGLAPELFPGISSDSA